MSKPIDKSWIALTIARIISIMLAIFAVILLIGAINLFHDSNQYGADARAYPHVAEDQPHGLDALAAIFAGGFGLVFIVASIVLFIIALPIFIGTSLKLKKAALAKQQSKNQAITLGAQQTATTPPHVPQQNSKISGTPDNNQRQDIS